MFLCYIVVELVCFARSQQLVGTVLPLLNTWIVSLETVDSIMAVYARETLPFRYKSGYLILCRQ